MKAEKQTSDAWGGAGITIEAAGLHSGVPALVSLCARSGVLHMRQSMLPAQARAMAADLIDFATEAEARQAVHDAAALHSH